MSDIGYAWIQNAVGAPDFLGQQRARLAPVNRIERQDDGAILVPHKLAPEPTLLQQALFVLKHEGVRLGLLVSALRRIPPADLAAWVQATPNSIYGRKLGYRGRACTNSACQAWANQVWPRPMRPCSSPPTMWWASPSVMPVGASSSMATR